MGRFVGKALLAVGFIVVVSAGLQFAGNALFGWGEPESAKKEDGAGELPRFEGENASGDEISSPDQVTVEEKPGGGVPIGEVDIRVKEGRTNGQREFAQGFVAAVYGSPGSGSIRRGAYLAGVGEFVDRPIYLESEGGSFVEDRAGELADGDAPQSAAVLVDYEILSGPDVGNEVQASAVREFMGDGAVSGEDLPVLHLVEAKYAVGDAYKDPDDRGRNMAKEPEESGSADASTALSGDVRYYSQRLLLSPFAGGGVIAPAEAGSAWSALGGATPFSVVNPNSGAPDPSEPKVGEPLHAEPGHS